MLASLAFSRENNRNEEKVEEGEEGIKTLRGENNKIVEEEEGKGHKVYFLCLKKRVWIYCWQLLVAFFN